MSDTSGGVSQVISLPKSGGALKGIGEKFSPDLHTGTGNFTVPVDVPPGRNGLQPNLSLNYSTGAGNGPFGIGWGLSVPGVTRKTSHGLPTYDDEHDVFVLSGAEDLVPIGHRFGVTLYRPRTEGLFARVEHHRGAGTDFWKVWSRDGLVSLYGTPRPTGTGPEWRDPAVVADPAAPGRIFGWKLSQTTDLFGNRIEYEYLLDAGRAGEPAWVQTYLRRVRYLDHGEGSEAGFLLSAVLDYEDRLDVVSDRRATFEIRTRWRCRQIAVHSGEVTTGPVRTQQLRYDNNSLNGVSLLTHVLIEGHDGERAEALPPLEFGYTPFEPEGREFVPLAGAELPLQSLADPALELVDLNGNGLVDILETGGGMRYWRNLGGGRFDRPRQMRDSPGGVTLADPGVELIDANGDGRVDLLVNNGALAGFFSLRADGEWDRRSFQRYEMAPSFAFDDPEVRLVDLDGDGATDAIRSGTRFECFFHDPQRGWHTTRLVERGRYPEFPDVSFADPRIRLADMTGDGLQDIVVVHNGRIEYWPSLGRGNWSGLRVMRDSPRYPDGYDPRRILVGDVDGDGVADIVYVDDDKVTLWINQSGQGWSGPIQVKGTPRVSDMSTLRLVDLLGHGVSGLLWSSDASQASRPQLFFLDFTGGIKPAVLNEMNNNTGAVTRISYASSTRFYLDDETNPSTRWATSLPFPVQVVAAVEVVDQISGGKLTTEYRYHHGYWDGAEQEFRGFGRVDQRDTEVFERYNAGSARFARVDADRFAPPLETRTWFHQGPIGEERGDWKEYDLSREYWPEDSPALIRPPQVTELLKTLPRRARRDALRALRGHVLRTELYELDGSERESRPVTVTETVPGLREESPPAGSDADRRRIFFPHPLATRTTQWERGADPMTQLSFTDDYDTYGHPRSQITIAVPRGRDFRLDAPGEPCLATQTVTTYAHRDDDRRYLVGRAARTTVYELLDQRVHGVLRLHAEALRDAVPRTIVGQTLNFYDGRAFEGLPFGQLGEHGVLSRTDSLVLTEQILAAVHAGDASPTAPAVPPYLVPGTPGSTPAWTPRYPQEFRDRLAPFAGHVFQPGGAGSPYARGYFTATRQKYDVQSEPTGRGRGLLVATRDPLGGETTVAYDVFALLPSLVTDPAGLTTQASHDYRVFLPREITDPNGNRTAFGYTPVGLLDRTAVMAKPGQPLGDTLEVPGTRLIYDLLAFAERAEPVSVRTVRRVHHVNGSDVPAAERDQAIDSVEYSDGFGRLLQTRTQAEDVTFGDLTFGGLGLPAGPTPPPGDVVVGRQHPAGEPPRVVVSGWQTYDNKGRVVEEYEPFFSAGYGYAPPTDAELGRKATMIYDARGRMVRTVNPDGSQQRVVHGVPADLADPDRFAPTAWQVFTYDANDNAGRTHPAAAAGYREHWNTPSSVLVDPLGREIEAVMRTGPDPLTWHTTRSSYDIQGNLLTLTDELGRVAFRHTYDLAKHPLRTQQLDAGVTRTVLDAAGRPVQQQDAKGALALHAYDVAHRPVRMWAADAGDQPVTLRQVLVYGDAPDAGVTRPQAAAANLLGVLVRSYDEAGLVTVERCDFTGNVLESVRQVVSDDQLLSVYQPAAAAGWQVRPWQLNWQPPAGTSLGNHAASLLDPAEYRISSTFDALGRARTLRYPQDVDGHRAQARPHYNRAGALERVELDGTTFVERIAYDAKGQRTLVVYGNGVLTRYGYDLLTFRLTRLRTERFTALAPLTYRPSGAPLQDFAYSYDLAANLLTLLDRTPGSGILNNPDAAQVADRALARLVAAGDALVRRFGYDPRYRLLSATGREHDLPQPSPPWGDVPGGTEVTRTRGYLQRYAYDPAGNLTELRHQAGAGLATRTYSLVPGTNRLAALTVGQTQFRHRYDAAGNLVAEGDSRRLEWDHANRMRAFQIQAGSAEPSIHAQYLYDAAGQRVRKLVRKQGGQVESTTYIGGIFEHHRRVQGSTRRENNTLHVMDDQNRIALLRIGPPAPDDATPAVKYHLGDHLGSANLTLNSTGAEINREEYTPYGESSFGGFARKRYRFTGKERDEESSLYYHGARYYAPWLARWTSCDPAGTADGTNMYQYALARPMALVDPTGTQSAAPDQRRTTGVDAGHAPATSSDPPEIPAAERNKTRMVDSPDPGPAIGPPEPPDPYLANQIRGDEIRSRGRNIRDSGPLGALFLIPAQAMGGDKQALDRAVAAGTTLWGIASSVPVPGAGVLPLGVPVRPKNLGPSKSLEGQTSGQNFLLEHLQFNGPKEEPDPLVQGLMIKLEKWYPGVTRNRDMTIVKHGKTVGEIDIIMDHVLLEVKSGEAGGATKKMMGKLANTQLPNILYVPDLHGGSKLVKNLKGLKNPSLTVVHDPRTGATFRSRPKDFGRLEAELGLWLALNPHRARLQFNSF